MRVCAWLFMTIAACVLAEEDDSKGASKLPFIADAVGNTLPPPSNGPAIVGSPSNLLTPDRYEFYTFDESGELVKRLMTLEEIQAIVAAGEGTDGGHLVTFANDDQPTIAFNFSQPPFTKVHSVVTNVQNVLKAQMEAQKNNPPNHAALDTPDVSESWSLILPSVFGNTGVDIVPDKSSSTFSTPETETIEKESPITTHINENTLSKEETNEYLSSIPTSTSVTKASTVTERSPTTTTKLTKFSSTGSISSTSTVKPRLTTKSIIKSTTVNPRTTIKSKPVTRKPQPTKSSYTTLSEQKSNSKSTPVVNATVISTTEKVASIIFEKISTVTTPLPSSTKGSETNSKKTNKPLSISRTTPTSIATKKYTTLSTTEVPLKIQPPVTTYKPIQGTRFTVPDGLGNDKGSNATTLTTQSVSPSTSVSTTEYMSIEPINLLNDSVSGTSKQDNNKPTEENVLPTVPDILVFDVAQSFSQIASDLGNNFPNPTTSNVVETSKLNNMELESKENLELDIPVDNKTESTTELKTIEKEDVKENTNPFVKISTIDPSKIDSNITEKNDITYNVTNSSDIDTTTSEDKLTIIRTTIDPILSESMDDLLSQIVNEAPQTIVQSTTTSSSIITNNDIASTPKLDITSLNIDTTTLRAISNVHDDISLSLNSDDQRKDDKYLNSTEATNVNRHNISLNGVNNIPSNNASKEFNEKYIQISTTSNIDLSTYKPDNISKVEDSTSKMKNNINELINENNNLVNKIDNYKNQTITKENVRVNKININTTFGEETRLNDNSNKNNLSNESESEIKFSVVKLENIKPQQTKNSNIEIKTTIDNHKSNLFTETITKDEFKKKIQKVNIDDKELVNNVRNNSWKLISTVSPPKVNEIPKDKIKTDNYYSVDGSDHQKEIILDGSKENQGLEVTTKDLGEDISQFSELCNELAFRYWNAVVENVDKKRSFVLSPYSITSMLAMMFMGARGATSGEMNEILRLDDMVTFNPHFTLKNISDSIETTPESGVVISAFIRELYSDRNKGNVLTFYKERAQHFYNGHVEEVNFKLISDIIRRRTNLLVKRYTWGKIGEYMKSNSISMQPPLAAFSTNIFETDCTGSSVEGRDGEMYFVVSPNVRQRRLVPVPAVVYKRGFLAGYDPALDATAAALGTTNSIVTTLFLMPGQQGNVVHADDLDSLERRLLDSNPTTPTWNRLLRTLLPRIGLELQIPRYSHKSTFNISSTLKAMGLKDLFNPQQADLGGLNGPSKDLYLSDMIQVTSFVTCGEGVIGEQHHIEQYPESPEVTRRRRTSRWTTGWDEPRDYQRAFHDPHDVGEAMHLPLHLRPRQARLPARNAQPARLKFDRPFLYFVRHNPSGMILYVGRYNPRLLP